MIINNAASSFPRAYQTSSLASEKSVAEQEVAKAVQGDERLASDDRLQGQDKLSQQGAALNQSSVAAAERSSNQASEKRLDEAEAEISRRLSERDREVKNHERIHASVGGPYTSAPSYTYQRGPDGQLYAVAGEVRIDTSPVPDDPQATLEKAEVIIRAALSVPEPSSADRRVAAEARAMAAEARAEIAKSEETQVDETSTEEAEAKAEEEDKKLQEDEKDNPSLFELNQEQQENDEAAALALQDFNDRLNEIQRTLREINLKLVDAGVFQKLFPEGSVIDKNV